MEPPLTLLTSLQVVHADMKTKNILLSAGRMTAKIADVGLARYMAQTHMDTKSLPMGTFVYAAPELLLGRRSDHKASSPSSPAASGPSMTAECSHSAVPLTLLYEIALRASCGAVIPSGPRCDLVCTRVAMPGSQCIPLIQNLTTSALVCKRAACGAQVDIYSVGIILWELVTLMTPARGNLRSVKVPEECPADVAHLIEDCLNANNPDERPTASQIYDRLISRCLPQALRTCRIPPLPSPPSEDPA